MKLLSRKAMIVSAKCLVSITILFWLARGHDFQALRSDLLAINPGLFLLAVLLLFAQTLMLSSRWLLILRTIDVQINWRLGWRILMVGTWFNQVLPSGGDVVRIWMLRRHGTQWSQTISSVVADRFVALLGLVALMLAGVPLLLSRVGGYLLPLTIVGIAAAACIGSVVLVTLDRWPSRIIAILPHQLVQFATQVRAPLLASQSRGILMVTTIAVHLVTIAACYVLAAGIQANLSALDAFVLIPLVILSAAVPISIGGWGVREGAMVASLGLAGIASDKALAVSVLLGVAGFIVGLFGALVWLAAPERASFSAGEAKAVPEQFDKASTLSVQIHK